METLDWTQLASTVVPDKNRIPYEPNKHLFKKVAFDVFQLSGSPIESLWTLEDGEDGSQYLVAQYEDGAEAEKSLESKSYWAALSDRDGQNVTLTYKNTPIQRFASTEYGFTKEDVHLFQDAVVEKIASSESFVSKFLKSQPKVKLDLLVSQFPELSAIAAMPPEEDLPMMDPEVSEEDPFVDYEDPDYSPAVSSKSSEDTKRHAKRRLHKSYREFSRNPEAGYDNLISSMEAYLNISEEHRRISRLESRGVASRLFDLIALAKDEDLDLEKAKGLRHMGHKELDEAYVKFDDNPNEETFIVLKEKAIGILQLDRLIEYLSNK